MNINYKKSLKLITLLITSLLISFVSAQTYSELFMHATPITIGTAGIKFVNGTDTMTMGGADAINTPQTEVTFDIIPPIEPGETRTYYQAVNITNNAGATKTLNMSLYSLTGNFDTNFDYINVTIIAANGTSLGNSIEIVSPGTDVTSTGNIQMANGETWTVRWIIKAKTDATQLQSIDIKLKVKVE
jgi:hypothetical protein